MRYRRGRAHISAGCAHDTHIDPRTHTEQECRRPLLKLLRLRPPQAQIRTLYISCGTHQPSELPDLRVLLSDFFDADLLPASLRLIMESLHGDAAAVLLALELLGRENSNVRSLTLRYRAPISPELTDKLIDVLSAGKCLCDVCALSYGSVWRLPA